VPVFFVVIRRLFPGGHETHHATAISSGALSADEEELKKKLEGH
jgi:hypothetical protein